MWASSIERGIPPVTIAEISSHVERNTQKCYGIIDLPVLMNLLDFSDLLQLQSSEYDLDLLSLLWATRPRGSIPHVTSSLKTKSEGQALRVSPAN